MALTFYSVTLNGSDDKGRFQIVVRVGARDEPEAIALARGSAALKGVNLTDEAEAEIDAGAPKILDDTRRVLGHGEKTYIA